MAALMHENRYISPLNDIFKFALTGWSWIDLTLGILVLAVGIAVSRDSSCIVWPRSCSPRSGLRSA